MGKAGEPYQVYQEALQFEPDNADLHYNLGVVLIELAKPNVALEMFNNALEVDAEHLQSLTNSAILMQMSACQTLMMMHLHSCKSSTVGDYCILVACNFPQWGK